MAQPQEAEGFPLSNLQNNILGTTIYRTISRKIFANKELKSITLMNSLPQRHSVLGKSLVKADTGAGVTCNICLSEGEILFSFGGEKDEKKAQITEGVPMKLMHLSF